MRALMCNISTNLRNILKSKAIKFNWFIEELISSWDKKFQKCMN